MLRYIIRFLLLLVTAYEISSTNQKNWEYTIISVFTNSSDTNILNLDLKVITLGRSLYAISGICDVKVEAHDDFHIQANLYRSANGGSRYSLMPMQIENQTLSSFMNNGYKEYLMASIRKCSDAPQFTDTWIGPQPPKLFTLDKCTIMTDNLPNYMHPGFYKILAQITSNNVEAHIIAVVKVENVFT